MIGGAKEAGLGLVVGPTGSMARPGKADAWKDQVRGGRLDQSLYRRLDDVVEAIVEEGERLFRILWSIHLLGSWNPLLLLLRATLKWSLLLRL